MSDKMARTHSPSSAGTPSIAVVMDPIDHIKFAKDSTLAMLLAAQARGWSLHYLEQKDLWLRDGVAFGRSRPLRVFADPLRWFELGDAAVRQLGSFDALLMRKDPPFDTEYIYTSYILERAEEQGCLVVNRARGLRDMNEKVYTAWFPECCAPTLITRDMTDMAAFLAEHGKVVCKPLYGMGGRSIFVVEQGDKNRQVIFETLTEYGTRFAIAQRYIPDIVTTGDARVLLVDGEPIPYALARIPSAEDNRGNLAAGAKGVGRPLDERDRFLAGRIGPKLAEQGMLFVGLDVIGGFVTEINVTSPTGIRELDKQFGLDIASTLMDAIDRRLATRTRRPATTP
jgi:glutathione synthase